ncbi:hypothetical protein [Rhodococcus marinonascens]|nr:hypothetical protein [Rhodococcus marinonascens]
MVWQESRAELNAGIARLSQQMDSSLEDLRRESQMFSDLLDTVFDDR